MATESATISTGLLESSLTTNTNFLQPTGFKLSISRKYLPNPEYFAQSVQHPGASINTIEVPYKRIGSLPFTGGTMVFGEASAMIVLDEDMSTYTEMYNWINSFVDRPDVKSADGGSKLGPSVADITVSILTSSNVVKKKLIYRDAIPTLLGDINFEAATGDVQYMTFPISFRFSYFDLV